MQPLFGLRGRVSIAKVRESFSNGVFTVLVTKQRLFQRTDDMGKVKKIPNLRFSFRAYLALVAVDEDIFVWSAVDGGVEFGLAICRRIALAVMCGFVEIV